MFGISGTELFLIAVFALLIFGPDKIPQFARTIGKFTREFKRAQESMESLLRAEMYTAERVAAADASKASELEPDDDEDEEEEEDEE